MKQYIALTFVIGLLTLPCVTEAGSLHIGIISALKNKIEEIKAEKEKAPPSVSLLNPKEGATLSGKTLVRVEVSDFGGMEKVEFYIDGVRQETATAEPYRYEWDTTRFSNGVHSLEVKAYDAHGQTSSVYNTFFLFNDFLPSVSLISSQSSPASGTVELTVDAVDDKGVEKVEFFVDATLKKTDADFPYAFLWNSADYDNGYHTILVKVYDTVKQVATAEESILVENDHPPAVKIKNPTGASLVSGSTEVTTEITDDKGITKVEFYINDVLKATDTIAPYSYSLDTSLYRDAEHSPDGFGFINGRDNNVAIVVLEVRAYDTSNQPTSVARPLILENDEPPTAAILSPTGATIISGSTDVTVNAQDDQRVVKVLFYVDGGFRGESSPPFSYIWDTTQDSNGTYMLKVKALDTLGQSATIEKSVTLSNGSGHWEIGIVESGSAAQSPSLVLDSSNNPHLSYYDSVKGDLKYTHWTGISWSTATVTSVGNAGSPNSLVLDKNSQPHIAYYDLTSKNLRYAHWNGIGWKTEMIDSAAGTGKYNSLALDSSGNPHLSYYDDANGDLKYARRTADSTWFIETVDETGIVGLYCSLVLDGNGNPRISYFDATNGDLKYAQWTGTIWTIEIVDSTSNVGHYSSMAIDGNSDVHIAYYDSIKNALKYTKRTGNNWSIETVEETTFAVGADISLDVDSANNPHISYRNITNSALKYAHWSVGSWRIETVESPGNVGYQTSIKVDSDGTPHIAYYDAGIQTIKHSVRRP